MNDFYLTLPCNAALLNTTANFSVHLPQKLNLQGRWEIAPHLSPSLLCAELHLTPSHVHQPITGLWPGYVILNSQSAAGRQGDQVLSVVTLADGR
ncbi:MAG: hypothetical protein GY696_19430 [Gammaproteobacteria bacterium]|nr:hypothetical protein [Gammaproteobacteria bacterium]